MWEEKQTNKKKLKKIKQWRKRKVHRREKTLFQTGVNVFIMLLDCIITAVTCTIILQKCSYLITCRMQVILLWSTISWVPWMRTMMENWHFRNSGSWLANWQAHTVASANNFKDKQFEISHWFTCKQFRSEWTTRPSRLALTQRSKLTID